MAPIHDTDVAQERWSKAEWEHYELWERIELRLRRRKWLWISLTVVLFVALSSVPIVSDRWAKWSALAATRRLAQEINQMKREAAVDHVSYRIRFAPGGSLGYVIEKAARCTDFAGPAAPESVRAGNLVPESRAGMFALLGTVEARDLGVPGLVSELCYDALSGAAPATAPENLVAAPKSGEAPESLVGFGVIPAQDLAEKRTDRLSVLLLRGPSAEATFD